MHLSEKCNVYCRRWADKNTAMDILWIHRRCIILIKTWESPVTEGRKAMANKVLLVEDDAQISGLICEYFADKGDMEITAAMNGREGLRLAAENEYDLILLDVMLPGVDGFTICREIRRKNAVPILFITARGREEDILLGYDLGCDDYIVKPFLLAALYAKVAAVIKRSKGTVISSEMVCGGIRLDPVRLTVTADGKELDLAPKEFRLLKYLMENKDCPISRDRLLDRVWGMDFDGFDRVVDNHIKKLRKALGSCGGQIKTVITKGYKISDN